MGKRKPIDAPEWFFMWSTGSPPYITAICGWTRKRAIMDAEAATGVLWKTIYGRGGRVVRCRVTPINVQAAKEVKS